MKLPRPQKLGKTLIALRGNLSQKDFASILGVSQPVYNNWEKNKHGVDYPTAFWIAHCLHISVDELWSGNLSTNAIRFALPPEDVEALKPLIESVRTIRSQWGKRSEVTKLKIKGWIHSIMEESRIPEEEIQKTLNYLERK